MLMKLTSTFWKRHQVERAGDNVGKIEKDSDAATEFRTQGSADHEVSSTALKSISTKALHSNRIVPV